MARGFHFHLSTHNADDLTVEKAREVATGLGQRLSEAEHNLLHAAVEAAKGIIASLGHPASVEFHGVDSLSVPGDDTAVSVTVSTPVTVTPDAGPVIDITSSSTEAPGPVGTPTETVDESVGTPTETVEATPEPEATEAASGEPVVG